MGCDGCLPPRRAQLPNLVDKTNAASDVWADTAYRSAKNEKQIHRKKPQGKPMPEAVARANGKKSKVRAYVEHVFAHKRARWILSFEQSVSPEPR
jgi:IS5 family transposase